MSSKWYFAKDGTSHGPINLEDLRRDLNRGELAADTLVWNESMPNWQAASSLPEFRASPPPLPAGAPPAPPVTLTEPRRTFAAPEPWSPEARATAPQPTHQSQTGPDGLYIGAPSRKFGEAISTCFNKFFTFSGRASRSEYWYFSLFNFIIGLIPLVNLIGIVLIIPGLAVGVRRLHDTNRSGWWMVAPFFAILVIGFFAGLADLRNPQGGMAALAGLAFVGWTITMLVFMCTKGDPGQNRFG